MVCALSRWRTVFWKRQGTPKRIRGLGDNQVHEWHLRNSSSVEMGYAAFTKKGGKVCTLYQNSEPIV